MIIGGPILYDIADVEDLYRWYRDLLPSLPDELSGWINVTQIPAAPPFPEHLWARKAGITVWCCSGPHDRADEALAEIRNFGDPLVVGLAPMPYSVLQTAFDALLPKGLVLEGRLLRADHRRRRRSKSSLWRDDPDAAVDHALVPHQRCGCPGA